MKATKLLLAGWQQAVREWVSITRNSGTQKAGGELSAGRPADCAVLGYNYVQTSLAVGDENDGLLQNKCHGSSALSCDGMD
ncbi:hypothetical protein FKZ61_023475 [Litorilinea aerophila]|uniref:hypothetical protein n=1 Tax=Litorilinea aerophila TaxID=1204385 RepID=UPI0014772CAC|nr:hypothetical protein [Litorilinea aerophila]MCC9079055.1 hypothetical protein [Litorilinea aerophila]